MKRHLFLSWSVLIVLTTLGYVTKVSTGVAGAAALAIPLAAAAIKFSLVAWTFMELRSVSRIWAAGIGVLLVIILGLAVVLQMKVVAGNTGFDSVYLDAPKHEVMESVSFAE